VPLYGIPLLNAKKQFYEHFCANSIARNTRTNHIRYAVLLLFGNEKTKYRRKLIDWEFLVNPKHIPISFKKSSISRAFFVELVPIKSDIMEVPLPLNQVFRIGKTSPKRRTPVKFQKLHLLRICHPYSSIFHWLIPVTLSMTF